MRSRSLVRLVLVLILVAVGAAAVAGEGKTHRVDKTVPLPKTGLAELKFHAGPVVFEEVIVRNMPDEEDIAKSKEDPDDNCHPKLAVGMSNPSGVKMKVHLIVRLEDGEGNIYMSCDRDDTVSAGADNDHTNLCWLDSMKTKDFPKVTRIHIIATVSPD